MFGRCSNDRARRAAQAGLTLRLRVADLGCPQPVPEGEQNHGGVAVTETVALGRLNQFVHLAG
jgi:hypothetical protein